MANNDTEQKTIHTEKKVAVLINHAPCGSIHFAEGLRAAMGLITCTDELNITVVFLGEGVYGALFGVDRGEASRYIATMAEWGSKLNVERDSLAELGIHFKEVDSDVRIISRSQVRELVHAADFIIDF